MLTAWLRIALKNAILQQYTFNSTGWTLLERFKNIVLVVGVGIRVDKLLFHIDEISE